MKHAVGVGFVDVSSDEHDSEEDVPATPPSTPEPSNIDDTELLSPTLVSREIKTTTVTTTQDGVSTTTSEQVVTEQYVSSPTKRRSAIPRSTGPPPTPSRKMKLPNARSTPSPKKNVRVPATGPKVKEEVPASGRVLQKINPGSAVDPTPSFNPSKPHYSYLQAPSRDTEKFYVIIRGKRTGIFHNWFDVDLFLKRHGGSWQKFTTWADAYEHYKQAWEKDQVRLL
ncbi:hypothetical protein H0H93_015971 [Arthromyces matolae]|nr:hypothetical protein H0H93_015971 [Arthromyces matolae]